MARFPSAQPGHAERGLFTREEIHVLMASECARARRYGHHLSAMVVGVDRLDQLGDLYGYESRETILAQLVALLRSSVRESDWLCATSDGAFELLFPHTGRREAPAIARRLLGKAARLVFDEGASAIQVTLSIGLTTREAGQELELHRLLAEARKSLEQAQGSGGNRFRVFVPEKKPEPVVVRTPAPPPPPTARVDTGELSDTLTGRFDELTMALETLLSRRVRELFDEMGERLPDFGGHEREVLELAVQKLESEREQRRKLHEEQVDMLQRRLTKLSDSLELTEEELKRVMKMKSIDPGVASIYRTVQGLDTDDADNELKKEMMGAIFEANLELQQQYRSE